MYRASIIGVSRLKMGTDGHGITTLVAFHGCTLHCKYCLNPICLEPKARAKQIINNTEMILFIAECPFTIYIQALRRITQYIVILPYLTGRVKMFCDCWAKNYFPP